MAAARTRGGIGVALRRREDPRLLMGQGCYTDDFSLPDQAHMAVLRAPHAHARIVAIDSAAARAMPGVSADAAAIFSPTRGRSPCRAPCRARRAGA